jgi:hypothetical protein
MIKVPINREIIKRGNDSNKKNSNPPRNLSARYPKIVDNKFITKEANKALFGFSSSLSFITSDSTAHTMKKQNNIKVKGDIKMTAIPPTAISAWHIAGAKTKNNPKSIKLV